MKNKFFFILILVSLTQNYVFAQQRYIDTVFSTIKIDTAIQYGSNIDYLGKTQNLLLDVYQPDGDTALERPVIIWIHGGGFTSGARTNSNVSRYSEQFAHMGYVTASIDYRLGIGMDPSGTNQALYRAVQDAKAAIRYFRKNKNLYRIDTAKVIIAGCSAGSHAAIHTAYWNESEVSSYMDTIGLGSLEGNSGNAGYSSYASAIVNFWGAINDTGWIQSGEPMIVSCHGINDSVVSPYASQQSSNTMYGSIYIDDVAEARQIPHELKLFDNAIHNLMGGSSTDMVARWDTAITITAEFLYCNLIANCNDTTKGTTSILYNEKPQMTPAFSIYPNPAFDNITITKGREMNEDYMIVIYDMTGKKILQKTVSDTSFLINIHDLCFGAYKIYIYNNQYDLLWDQLLLKN